MENMTYRNRARARAHATQINIIKTSSWRIQADILVPQEHSHRFSRIGRAKHHRWRRQSAAAWSIRPSIRGGRSGRRGSGGGGRAPRIYVRGFLRSIVRTSSTTEDTKNGRGRLTFVAWRTNVAPGRSESLPSTAFFPWEKLAEWRATKWSTGNPVGAKVTTVHVTRSPRRYVGHPLGDPTPSLDTQPDIITAIIHATLHRIWSVGRVVTVSPAWVNEPPLLLCYRERAVASPLRDGNPRYLHRALTTYVYIRWSRAPACCRDFVFLTTTTTTD